MKKKTKKLTTEQLDKLTPTARRLLDKMLTGDLLWMPHPDNEPQMSAYCSEADIIYFGGAAGGGKALASGEPVVTPWGTKAIGDLKVGDQIANPDGTTQRVLYVTHQGVQDLFEVNFRYGTSVKCTGDHLWLYYYSGNVNRGKLLPRSKLLSTIPDSEGWRVASTSRLVKRFENNSTFAPYVPLPNTVNFDSEDDEDWKLIDPYVLGVLLGDGCFTGNRYYIGLTCSEQQVFEEVQRRTLGTWATYEGSYQYQTRGKLTKRLRKALKRLGLWGTYSDTKFVPRSYLLAPTEVRLELLQGLMDSDGSVSRGNGECRFTTTSPKLAQAVRLLVWSLGGNSSLSSYTDKMYYNPQHEEYRDAKDSFRVQIQLSDKSKLFKLDRKKAFAPREHWSGRGSLKRRIMSITPIGRGDATCIAVDHPNGLFLTRDFVVTHNSDLLLGLALTDHKKSVVFRREYKQLRELVDRSTEILEGTGASYSATAARWSGIPGNRILEFGAVQHEKDRENYKGRPHDLIGFDEVPDFTETQFRFLIAWNRSTISGQRCRVVCAGNPPTTPEGRWVTRYWAPWIRKNVKHRAKPGELLWFVTMDGIDTLVEETEPFLHKGERLIPKSRTFIPAYLEDNPYLASTGYRGTLQGLPEPLRSQLLYGDFLLNEEPQINQTIPSEWVRKAQERWSRADSRMTQSPTHVGIDPSRGGKDDTVFAPRVGTFFQPLIVYPGRKVKTGGDLAAFVTSDFGEEYEGEIRIDIIGIGSSGFDTLYSLDYLVVDVNFSEKSFATDRSGKLQMRNKRAEAYWKLREALDPEKGDDLALPPDEELFDDLTTPLWTRTSTGILIEKKDKVRTRLGRSPGKGDAVALSYMDATLGVFFD